jgi:hypothetical protein
VWGSAEVTSSSFSGWEASFVVEASHFMRY